MPSSGYGAGDAEDARVLANVLKEASVDPLVAEMLPMLLATYVAARLGGEAPAFAANAAYVEWDV